MRLILLSGADVLRLVPMAAAIDAMRSAFGQLSTGGATVPLRTPLEVEGGVALFMPGYLRETGALGGKIVSVFGGNAARGLPAIHALVLLLDAGTGVPRAVMDGTKLTALRTGAATGLATDLLARPEASVLAVFGAGVQARHQIEAVRTVRRVREVRLLDSVRSAAERLAAEVRASEDAPDVRVLDDPRAAVEGADVIVTATTSAHPVFPGASVAPGTHVSGIGSYTPQMQEVDEELVAKATVIVDARSGALAEAGDLVIPLRRGLITEDHVRAELGEVVRGLHPGRTRPDEITFFKSVGNAAQDLAVAARALAEAERRDEGTVVEL